MSDRVKSFSRVIALGVLFSTMGASASWAQLGGPGLSGNGVGPAPDIAGQQAPKEAPKRALPPALPGAKSDPSLVAPATKQASDMNPNDALFDSINRGDLAAARDAVNRGADLGAHNVLGMTPMDLAIDLSRNDILFMLLSERGADTSGRGAPLPPSKGAKALLAAQKQPVVERTRVTASVKVAAPSQPRVAKLFSGDGGTPVPQSGFLGFDSSGGRN
jgi:hypothetical protein